MTPTLPCPDCVERGEDIRPVQIGGYCRRDYNRRWRSAQANRPVPPPRTEAQGLRGPLPDAARSARVKCRRDGCSETVTLRGQRFKRWTEDGVSAYHAAACMKADRPSAWVEGECACGCGETWRKYRSEVAKSVTGRIFVNAEHANSGGRGTKPRLGREVPCEGCGEPMYVSAGEDGKKRFHSQECRNLAREASVVRRTCPVDRTVFTVAPSQMADKQFCSKHCYRLAQITRAVPGQFHNGMPKRYDDKGYVLIYEPTHPASGKYGWVAEHRWVAEQEIVGRFLSPVEEVDHINEVKDDTRPENLRVKSKREHAAITAASIHRRRRAGLAELEAYRAAYGPINVEEVAQ